MFQQDNIKPHSAAIITAWVCSRQVLVVRLTACSPDLSPAENIWCIKEDRGFFVQLESFISIPEVVSSIPRCLKTFIKRKGYAIK